MKAVNAFCVLMIFELAVALSAHAQYTDFSPKFDVLTDADDARRALAVFNGYLKSEHLHLEPKACNLLLSATPGRVETIYTGICRLKNGAQIMICGDTGVGEFGHAPWRMRANQADTRKALLTWTSDHCGGG